MSSRSDRRLPLLSELASETVLSVLAGRDTPIPARDLAAIVGVDTRGLRDIISAMRRDGHPVCSSTAGYYLGDVQEIRASAARLLAHARHERQAARSLLRIAEQREICARQGAMFEEVAR